MHFLYSRSGVDSRVVGWPDPSRRTWLGGFSVCRLLAVKRMSLGQWGRALPRLWIRSEMLTYSITCKQNGWNSYYTHLLAHILYTRSVRVHWLIRAFLGNTQQYLKTCMYSTQRDVVLRWWFYLLSGGSAEAACHFCWAWWRSQTRREIAWILGAAVSMDLSIGK